MHRANQFADVSNYNGDVDLIKPFRGVPGGAEHFNLPRRPTITASPGQLSFWPEFSAYYWCEMTGRWYNTITEEIWDGK